MKNNKIATKLALYFTSALILFAITIGSIFFFLFKNYTIDVHRNELVHYAQSLAQTLADEENASSHQMMMSNSNGYLRFIEEIAGDDVWLVDKELNLLSTGNNHGMMTQNGHMSRSNSRSSMMGQESLTDLPENAKELITQVFQGNTTFSEGFSDTLNQPTLTVGAPITNTNGEIWGAILIHSGISGTKKAVEQGLNLLTLSLTIALVIALLFAIFLAYSFTKPLGKMKKTALRLTDGDYQAQTKLKQKDEIGELSQAIDTLASRLEEASQESAKTEQMRRDFVANISHELRTPVTVIRGSLEALNDAVVTDPNKVAEYHQQMLSEARFLERLVDDLLELSRLQNLDFQIEKAPVHLNDVLSDALRSARQLAHQKEIEILLPDTPSPLFISGDYGRLRQMFLIILDNAVKFSPPKSQIQVALLDDQLTICDQGPGIPEAALPVIFDRFHKTYGEHNKVGTGLGLAIAKEIAERHQMTLSATNKQPNGACFTFDFRQSEKIDATKLGYF